ncbi:related to isotrichodermin C-15 hydroxylase (cytochrome P-450 monooxygenase CYP65A1) [Phialocephala subalpina]|uniref:Related to isotrichodermin C-15 hydroxylase (Cytochrome P-450 monooxygenase CYP65A1) n=1 Tax=Phialocephala subalpina TaxID=576137 RepID=A0A1L7WBT4_9HELO|nr:related to isotrichodermin C-15 hydroxylase (cytochrome P-450 monooxygenase CYP65A1) [Phialocephala subalpina]
MEVFALLLNIASTVIVLSALFYAGSAIYNVTFHPLASFPGPTIYGASILPAYYDLCIGNSASRTLELHEKYGPVVRMTPNDLSFSSAQAWRERKTDIYGYRKGHKNLERDPRFFYVDPERTQNIIASNEANHARMRRVMIHAFSESALREQEPIITSYCDLLIQRLSYQQEAKGAVDIAAWLNFASFDIIGDLTFGESFHALEKGEDHWWMSTIFNGFKIGVMLPAVVRTKDKFRNFIRDKTLSRLSMETDRRDVTAVIMRHNDKKEMSERELITNAGCLIIAGSESTATLLSGLIFHLLSTPRVLALLQQEIRQAFTSQSAINFASVSKLLYLQACIEEALRLYPPMPCGLPRQVPVEGMIIDGHFVPGNTSVSMHQLSTGRSARNFKDPLKFVPERWLKDEPRASDEAAASAPQRSSQYSTNDEFSLRYGNDDFAASQPFAIGLTVSRKQNLAFAEMWSIMARLVWKFDMELQLDSLNWDQQKVYVLWSKPPLNVRLSAHGRTKNL